MLTKPRFFVLAGAVATLAFAQIVATGGNSTDANQAKIAEQQKTASPKNEEEISQADILRISEAFGHFIGRNLSTPGIKLDLESIIKGMRDGAAGKPAPMSDQEYEKMMAQLQEKAYRHVSEDNLKAANEFLIENAKKSGVVEIVPGKLQYLIIEEGKGEPVAEHSSPEIQYVGSYIDGTVFGNSRETGGAITIPLDQTIPGFSKGIIGMKEGEKRKLFVHPDLGYGTTGGLLPNSLLIFEVEVVKVNNSDAKTADNDEDETLSLTLDDLDDDEDTQENAPVKSVPTPTPSK